MPTLPSHQGCAAIQSITAIPSASSSSIARVCHFCGTYLTVHDRRQRCIDTLFGRVTVDVPRVRMCVCGLPGFPTLKVARSPLTRLLPSAPKLVWFKRRDTTHVEFCLACLYPGRSRRHQSHFGLTEPSRLGSTIEPMRPTLRDFQRQTCNHLRIHGTSVRSACNEHHHGESTSLRRHRRRPRKA